jgi:membrane protein DedA with SNARE-associated domain
LGAFVWSGTFCTAGYLFGEVPAVRQNLELAILAIGAVAIGKMVISAKKA